MQKPRRKKIHARLQRERKDYKGEMLQFDASDHNWLENRGPRFSLLIAIDDATSSIMLGRFVSSENTKDIMQFWIDYLVLYGRPLSLYTDRNSVYKVNIHNPENEKKSQFERACTEVDIHIQHAYSRATSASNPREFI